MRDNGFIAVHRGGMLTPEQHRQLMAWACACAGHVLSLPGNVPDIRLGKALMAGSEWIKGIISVGEARNASVQVHRAARESDDPVVTAVARSVGQAVATAHMADHAVGAALYALKAIGLAGQSVTAERNWQNEQLPEGIHDLVIRTRLSKERAFRIPSS